MSDRARLSKLDTQGGALLGSKYFPPPLLRTLEAHDPKAILFGAGADSLPPLPLSAPEQDRLRGILDARVRGKRLLLCSGADDKLVPYARSKPLLDVLKDAVGGWYRDGRVVLDDRVYEGVGHWFSAAMVRDSVAFLVEAVALGPRGREVGERSRI